MNVRPFLLGAAVCGSLFFAVLAAVTPASAASGPEEVVEQISKELQKAGNMSPILDYVHWPTAFRRYEPNQRGMLGIDTPEKMREHFEKALNDPEAFMRQAFVQPGQSADEKEKQEKLIEAGVAQLKKAQKELHMRLRNSTYSVGESQIEGNRARVELISKYKGEQQRRPVFLERIDGEWLLPSMNFSESSGAMGIKPVPTNAPNPLVEKMIESHSRR